MSIPYFDCHCDTPVEAMINSAKIKNNALHLDLERLAKYKPASQVFAICAAEEQKPVEFARKAIDYLKKELAANSDIAKLCLNFADIKEAERDGKIAIILSIEGAEQLTSLENAYSDGVRIIHLTWNFDNAFCGAAMDSGSGLTHAGRELVSAAQDMGVLIDLSHISERGFWDVLDISKRPVIAGHSDSRALCDVPRNISDEQFRALVKAGGGAGINLYPEFLGLGGDIDAVFAHIEHFMSLGGEKSVFLGCDLDGIDEMPNGISGVQDIAEIYECLLRHNYSEALAQDIFRNNLMRIMEMAL